MQGEVQNYATLIKRIKPKHEKKPVSNLKSMKVCREGFEIYEMY